MDDVMARAIIGDVKIAAIMIMITRNFLFIK